MSLFFLLNPKTRRTSISSGGGGMPVDERLVRRWLDDVYSSNFPLPVDETPKRAIVAEKPKEAPKPVAIKKVPIEEPVTGFRKRLIIDGMVLGPRAPLPPVIIPQMPEITEPSSFDDSFFMGDLVGSVRDEPLYTLPAKPKRSAMDIVVESEQGVEGLDEDEALAISMLKRKLLSKRKL